MKAKIYRIVLPCGGTYVGQTKKHVYQRWGQHLTDLDRGKHYNKQMQKSFDNNEVDDWKFEIIESIESDDKSYINLMEQHHAALEVNLINEHKMHVNEKERRASYKEMVNSKALEYYYDNHEERKKKGREYQQKKSKFKRAL
tara:strand:- start:43 stop:468 length:426 start_codon:yes stop_codon:yes gene_type:complete